MTAILLTALLGASTGVDWNKTGAEALQILEDYVRIDTTNPPGDVTPAADYLTRILEREGFAVTRRVSAPGKANLYARLKGAGRAKPVVLLHHMDVVPADKSRWPVDPFGATVKDGYVWGRGAMDMKGLGVVHLLAFLTLKRQAVPLDRDVIFMAVADEEVGGALGARYLIEKHYAEIDPEYVFDEGGFGSEDVFKRGKLVYGISVAEKKIVWLKLRATGVAGHGSQPHDQNPNDRLTRALARLLAEPFPTAPVGVLQEMNARVGELDVNKFTRAIQHSTLSLTTLRSGVGDPPKVNVIPSVAEATLDCRLLPGVATSDWLQEIGRRLGALSPSSLGVGPQRQEGEDPGITIEVTYESDPTVVTPHDTPAYRAFEAAILRNQPGAVVTPILIPYGTDSNAFRQKGAKSYGVNPMKLSSEIVASMHGDEERVPTAELAPAIRIFYEALAELDSRKAND